MEATAATRRSPAPEASGDRREQLLEAAVRVIANQGMRGLTHRSVESEAGLPHGSTTYYFGSRHDLTVALMQYMVQRATKSAEPIARQMTLVLADRSKPIDIESIARGLIQWIDSEAELERARYELQVTAARDPEMMRLMTEACNVIRRMCEPIVIASGSTNPELDAQIVQGALDGWMFDRLTHSEPRDETIIKGLTDLLSAIGGRSAA
ncbi:MAG: TetR/AcrR family transcriptional regulator [Solirubrobacterales bacterium]